MLRLVFVVVGVPHVAATERADPWPSVPGTFSGYLDSPAKLAGSLTDVPGQVVGTYGAWTIPGAVAGHLTRAAKRVGSAIPWPFGERAGDAGIHEPSLRGPGLKEVGHTRLSVDVQNSAEPSLLRGGDAGWTDPVHEFTNTLVQLRTAVTQTERDLQAALHACSSRPAERGGAPTEAEVHQACEHDRGVAEVRGRMRRLKVAMQRVASLKGVAFTLHREGRHALDTYGNMTALVAAAKVKLSSTEMQRQAIRVKLENLRMMEGGWRQDMHEVAKAVLAEKQRLGDAETRVQKSEDRRLQFMAQLHAVLEGVAVGDQAAELTYEEAEETLKKAKEREAHAKKMIFEAEKRLDMAYSKASDQESAKKRARTAGAAPIIADTDATWDNFGKGSASSVPLPVGLE